MKSAILWDKCVYLGGTMEELHWGYIQFPKLYEMADGNIGLFFHYGNDSPDALGNGKYLYSKDRGKTWLDADAEHIAMMGTVLRNGDALRCAPWPVKKLLNIKEKSRFGNFLLPTDDLKIEKSKSADELPYPIAVQGDIFGSFNNVYLLDTLPDGMAEKQLLLYKWNNKKKSSEELHADVLQWNWRTVKTYDPSKVFDASDKQLTLDNPGLFQCREIKIAPDGSLWIAHYRDPSVNPYTGVYTGKSAVFILRSTDEGLSWKLQGYIPYFPDEKHNIYAHLNRGFSEPSIEFAEDGTLLCLMRTCDVFFGAPEWGPTYLSKSYDFGKTWSQPEYFADRGALPILRKLDNGVLIAVITRPGIYIYVSRDNGKTWNREIEVMTEKDRSSLANKKLVRPNFWQYAGSCCNTSVLKTDKNRFLLAYSDFYIEDETGIKRKGIKIAEIGVGNA